jgi:RNA polymerase sigma factor (sigma-70 family)
VRETCSPCELVARCRQGDKQAWHTLIDTFTPLVWTVARSMRLAPMECEDVCQATWERAVTGIDTIRDPNKLSQWLVTVAKREAMRYRTYNWKLVPVGDAVTNEVETAPGPEEQVVRRGPCEAVLRAVAELPPRHQALVALLVADPPVCYDRISELLDMPRGSIGPTRSRVFARLHEALSGEL